jgi:RNA polymerase sigma-70 factor (ECF subfamily)
MKLLLQQAREGDKTAENEILRYLHVRFSLFAIRKIRDKEAAKDIVQDSCMTVLEKYKVETFTVGFEEWAWGVLSVNIKNYFRRISVESSRIASEQSADDLKNLSAKDVDPMLEMSILDCLERIVCTNHRFAQVLSLVHQGYRTSEICRMLNISESNCYVLLHRGRAMIKKCLGQAGYDV